MYFIDYWWFTYFYFLCIFYIAPKYPSDKTIVKILIPEISKEFQFITSANLYSRIPPIKLHQTVIFIKSLGHILLHIQIEERNHDYTRDTNFNVETQVGKKNHGGTEAKFTDRKSVV